MLHGRTDYDRIQDPAAKEGYQGPHVSNPIGEDEPVFLIRAKDALAPLAVREYAKLVQQRGNDPELVKATIRVAEMMEAWQSQHGKQFPDVLPHHYRESASGNEVHNPAATDPVVGAPGGTPPVHQSSSDAPTFEDRTSQFPKVASAEEAEAFFNENVPGTKVVCEKAGDGDAVKAHHKLVDNVVAAIEFFAEGKTVTTELEDKAPQATDDLEINEIEIRGDVCSLQEAEQWFLANSEGAVMGISGENRQPLRSFAEAEQFFLVGPDEVCDTGECGTEDDAAAASAMDAVDSADEGMLTPPEPGVEVPAETSAGGDDPDTGAKA